MSDRGLPSARNGARKPTAKSNVTCFECERLRGRLAEIEAALKSIKAAKRVKAYRERRAKS